MTSGWSEIYATATVSLIQLVLFYVCFECCRGKEKYQRVYQARLPKKESRTPPVPSKGCFSWLAAINAVDDEETYRATGLDTYVFLRFLRLGMMVTVPAAIFGCLILIPVFVTSEGVSGKNFNDLTASVVPEGGARLWAPWVFMNVFCLYVLYLIYKEAEHFVPRRLEFLALGDPETPAEFQLTAVVENVPKKHRTSGKLLELMNRESGGQAVTASLCLHTEHLEKLMAERQQAIEKIEQAVACKTCKPEKGEPTTKVGGACSCLCGRKVETIAHFEEELRRLNGEIDEEYRDIAAAARKMDSASAEMMTAGSTSSLMGKLPFGGSKKTESKEASESMSDEQLAAKWQSISSGTGYVKFSSMAARQEAIGKKYDGGMTVASAPEPNDVLWKNVTVTTAAQKAKALPCNVLWSLGILFWVIPITFIASISDLAALQEKLPWLVLPPTDSFLYGLLAGYLPVIMLIVFMMLIPIVIHKAAVDIIKYKALSRADSYTFVWHFGFQVANLFLLIIGGSFISQISDVIDDPMSIATLLAEAIPGKAVFFVNLAITATCTGLMLELSQLVAVIVKIYVMPKIKKPGMYTQRQLDASLTPGALKWGWIYPAIIFQFLVALVYAAITPMMLCFSAVYFCTAYSVFRHNTLYIYAQGNEGGGAIFYPLYSILMSCLYIAEFVFLAYLGLKQASVASPLMIPVIIITVVGDVMIRRRFLKPSRAMTVEQAGRADRGEAISGDDSKAAAPTATVAAATSEKMLYKQSALEPESWETAPMPYRTAGTDVGAKHVV